MAVRLENCDAGSHKNIELGTKTTEIFCSKTELSRTGNIHTSHGRAACTCNAMGQC